VGSRRKHLTSGELVYRWLDGSYSKKHNYAIGTIRNRHRFEAWAKYLTAGLSDSEFVAELQKQPDPWLRSRTVGERISQLKASYQQLTDDEKAQLARDTEIELKTGLEMVAKDKKQIVELITTAADP
jgi:hypothetical protein